MTRTLCLVATFSISILASACGAAATAVDSPEAPATERGSQTDDDSARGNASNSKGPAEIARLYQRQVGDYFVHRFSGTYRATPLVLTEEVLEHEGGMLVIEYTLDEGSTATKLRVRLKSDTHEVLNVSRLDGDREVEAPISDYHEMLAKTVFAPDYNEGRVARERSTCLVAGEEHDCERTRYHVLVEDRPATLEVTSSTALPGRDIGGRLETENGETIYRAELVKVRLGVEQSSSDRQAAALDYAPEGP
jgi:hypothetical protein